MDETAVSSDPVVALLLDEVVVKDWCKRTFKHIIAELQSICILQHFNFHLGAFYQTLNRVSAYQVTLHYRVNMAGSKNLTGKS